MTEERATYEIDSPVVAVRLENFHEPHWFYHCWPDIHRRYKAARLGHERRPQIALIELRQTNPWTPEDDAFFDTLRDAGHFFRWDKLAELPPKTYPNTTFYEKIGVRAGDNKSIGGNELRALWRQLQDHEDRAMYAEAQAVVYRSRALAAEEHGQSAIDAYNELVSALDQELRIKIYHQDESWIAEDAATGHVLLRDVALPVLYRKALQLRLRGKEEQVDRGGNQ